MKKVFYIFICFVFILFTVLAITDTISDKHTENHISIKNTEIEDKETKFDFPYYGEGTIVDLKASSFLLEMKCEDKTSCAVVEIGVNKETEIDGRKDTLYKLTEGSNVKVWVWDIQAKKMIAAKIAVG